MQDEVADRIPQEHKDKAAHHYEKGKKFFTEEFFPEERRDQFIYRGKKVDPAIVSLVLVLKIIWRLSSSVKNTKIIESR